MAGHFLDWVGEGGLKLLSACGTFTLGWGQGSTLRAGDVSLRSCSYYELFSPSARGYQYQQAWWGAGRTGQPQ